MRAWYNENDPHAAGWLRNLVAAGLLPQGDVDERSIVDVRPADLAGYGQCHFFAGIGGWPHALQLAGWGDRPVWTGSCPCQPLSSAGKRQGHVDERHLWPAFHRLIAECRPATVFGEQVASKDGREWIAAVRADVEAVGYACGASDLPAAGIGAPHIRQRLYWVAQRLADAHDARLEGRLGDAERAAELAAGQGGLAGRLEHAHGSGERAQPGDHREAGEEAARGARPDDSAAVRDGAGAVGRLADAAGSGRAARLGHDGEARDELHDEGRGETGRLADAGQERQQQHPQRDGEPLAGCEDGARRDDDGGRGAVGRLADADREQRRQDRGNDGNGGEGGRAQGLGEQSGRDGAGGRLADAALGGRREERADAGRKPVGDRAQGLSAGLIASGSDLRPSPTDGFWRDADWLHCRDGKWRPVEPGTFPLAHGIPCRVGRLRGAGNAIVAPLAAVFVGAVMEALA